MFSITDIKNMIKSIGNLSDHDMKVLLTADSYYGCPEYLVKARLAGEIVKYAGCTAWKTVMECVYGNR